MSFMDSLAANPSSGIYGQPSSSDQGYGTELALVNQLKDREMNDFKEKSNFNADLSLRQEARMRQLFPPEQGQQGQQNTVMAQDPNVMTAYQKGELGVRQQQLGLEGQRISQTGKLGEERLGIQSAQEKLNQQKSDQTNTIKQADMERKINEANQKLELAQKALESKTNNAEQTLQAHKDLAAAVEERHKLELDMKDHQFQITSSQHDKQIKDMEEKIKQSGRSKTTTELNSDGTKKTVTTERGSAAGTTQVTGRDGKTYEIPSDKVEDWNANHAAP